MKTKLLEDKEISFDDIVTCSEEVLKVLTAAKDAAQSEVMISITGESGTGKEILARVIHNNSPRKFDNFQSGL